MADLQRELDEKFMTLALEEGRRAALDGDVPVGALVVKEGVLVASGRNRKTEDPTAHAEILALRAAGSALKNWNLSGCTLYVTVEPCPMCAGALVLARLDRLVYGCCDPRAGACGTLYNIVEDNRLNHRLSVTRGVLHDECTDLIRTYFRTKRKAGPKK
ncbi:MAG: nucleoside deaminase [Synergistaceae bacterium]|nr:nucleoside deaminase [Synergistaceae bacterium]